MERYPLDLLPLITYSESTIYISLLNIVIVMEVFFFFFFQKIVESPTK